MISVIITGHGEFATGLLSALQLVAGEQGQVKAVVDDESRACSGRHRPDCLGDDEELTRRSALVPELDHVGSACERSAGAVKV